MLCWITWALQLMQNTMGIRGVKSIGFFNNTFSISILRQITYSGYQEHEIFTLGWWTAKIKVCFDITIKNDKIFVNTLFWNFDISEKKSADFSCLFTFFQKIYKFKNIYGTISELHNCLIKYTICLHFCNIADLCYNTKM